jgi:hypothetical protein
LRGFVNDDDEPRVRWRRLLEHWELHVAICGMMRTERVRRARPISSIIACEIVFLSELALQGKTLELPEMCSWKRMPDPGVPYRTLDEQVEYFDPVRRGRNLVWFFRVRVMVESVRGVRHAGVGAANVVGFAADALRIYARRHFSVDLGEAVHRTLRNQPRVLAAVRRTLGRSAVRPS